MIARETAPETTVWRSDGIYAVAEAELLAIITHESGQPEAVIVLRGQAVCVRLDTLFATEAEAWEVRARDRVARASTFLTEAVEAFTKAKAARATDGQEEAAPQS